MKLYVDAADDLIFNRYDMLYQNEYESYVASVENCQYEMSLRLCEKAAYVNVTSKRYPQEIYNQLIRRMLNDHPEILFLQVMRGYNNFDDALVETNDFVLQLPSSWDELTQRLSSKHRYNIKRMRKKIEEKFGKLDVSLREGKDIPFELIEKYYEWKKKAYKVTVETNPAKYISQYHITNALSIAINGKVISIVLFCLNGDTAYLENLSYDEDYAEYSVGFLGYEEMLRYLVENNYKYVFLGGGNYLYKKYYGAEERVAFSGRIYSPTYYTKLGGYFLANRIENVAIMGLGKYGKVFWNNRHKLPISIIFGIDQIKPQIEGLDVYYFEDDWPKIDAVIITIQEKDMEIENQVKRKGISKVLWEKELFLELERELYE